MDGLSAAASGIAVIQIAAQLTSGLIKLHDFWVTIREAPQEIADIVRDLRCLSSLLHEIANEQHHGAGLLGAMECCEGKIRGLMNVVREFEPNFSSEIGRVRFWNKFKAARKKQALKHFRDSLQETKITLLLALRPGCHLPPVYVNDVMTLTKSITNGPDPTSKQRPKASPLVQELPESALPPPYSKIVPLRSNTDPELASYCKSEPKLNRSLSDSYSFPYREAKEIDATDVKDFGTFDEAEFYPHSPIPSVSGVQASIRACVESALLPVFGKSFDISEFAKAINETIQEATVMQPAAYTYGKKAAHIAFNPGISHLAGSDFAEIHHQISATETPFGTVWLRTSTAKVHDQSNSAKGCHLVTSFVYYPSWWLSKLGLKKGVEISLSSSTKGWQCSLNPFRAVPDNSLIFDFCKTGNIDAVQRLILRGDASVQDTSSKGWTPLHFAAEAANVELCAYLISIGADKKALAYEGPTEDALSPVTIFGESAQVMDAQRKIAMLRLFLDHLDTSEGGDEGWTMVGSLVKSQNKENTSLAANSVSWLLRRFAGNVIRMEARTLWHGVQHAVRSFQILLQNDMVWQKLGELEMNQAIGKSHAVSIARWLALQIATRYLLPIIMVAAAIFHVDGFDWIGDTPEPSPVIADQQIPFLFQTWTVTLIDCIERVEIFATLEFETAVEQTGWGQAALRELNKKAHDQDPRQRCEDKLHCSTCKDDYTSLRAGLVEPCWISFADCVKAKHKSHCNCADYPRSKIARRYSPNPDGLQRQGKDVDTDFTVKKNPIVTSSNEDFQQQPNMQQDSRCDELELQAYQTPINVDSRYDKTLNEDDSSTEYCNGDSNQLGAEEEEIVIKALDDDNQNDYFKAAAHSLYRAQGRTWAGFYEASEQLCGSCFLQREGYVDEDGKDDEDIYSSMPTSFRIKAER